MYSRSRITGIATSPLNDSWPTLYDNVICGV
ncbi:hypothetical protein lh_157 [Escherichia phage LH01]